MQQMTRRTGRAGATGAGVAEYVGLVAAVAGVVCGLLVLRPQTISRTPPVRPLTPFVRILAGLAPPAPLRPPAARPAPRRPATRRPAAEPLVVALPRWFGR